MPRLRLNPLNSKEVEFLGVPGENLDSTLSRLLKESKIERNSQTEDLFQISLHGEVVPKNMWKNFTPKNHSEVLIAIVPKGGGDNSSLRTAIQIAAIISISAINPFAAGSVGATLFAIGGTLAVSLAVNALVPLPEPDLGNGDIADTEKSSQMYTVTAQSNKTKKLGSVPRVYGSHRVFPVVVANPYTQIEPSSQNGELVQFLYAVYDFGFGPLSISDIKIGDNPIERYNLSDVGDESNLESVGYRLVDLNKPGIDEGDWDSQLESDFAWYKGDVNQEPIGVNLNKNSDDPNAFTDEYQAIRDTAPDVENDKQEIQVNFTFPRGLITYGTDGNTAERRVDIKIEFAEVGTEDWYGWTNTSVVSDFSSVGNISVAGSGAVNVSTFFTYNSSNYWLGLKTIKYGTRSHQVPSHVYSVINPSDTYSFSDEYIRYDVYLPKGQTYFNSTQDGLNGTHIIYQGEIIAQVVSTDILSYNGRSYFRYNLDRGLSRDLFVFSDYSYKGPFPGTKFYYGETSLDAFNFTLGLSFGNSGSGILFAQGNKAEPAYATARFNPINTGVQYKVRVTRVRSYGGYSYRVEDNMTWNSLTTRFDRKPIVTDKRHVFLEVKIKATDQLNGSISNLSGIATSVLDTWDNDNQLWVKKLTSNPAWIYADILTGIANKKPLDKNRLDVNSLYEWSEFCDETPPNPDNRFYTYPRFESNFVLDFKTTVKELINKVCSSAQASLNLVNGTYGVLIDKKNNIPVQVFTPRNSQNFSMSRTYNDIPHGFKVKYIDQFSNWEIRETIVYTDGYDEFTATDFEEVDTFACTNDEQAWRFGRYMLFQAILRQETYSIEVDWENLVCTRGDFVKFSHDAMKAGGSPSRVKSISGNVVTIDDGFVTQPTINYGYTFRNEDEIYTGTMTITGSDTAELDGNLPNKGDLFVYGEVDKITIDCLVKSIEPLDDLRARIVMVEKADEIYDAESSGTLPEYDPNIATSIDPDLNAPALITDLAILENTYRCGSGVFEYYITTAWTVPPGSVYDKFEVYKKNGTGYDLVGITKETTFQYIVQDSGLGIEHFFKVLAVSSLGDKKPLGEAIEVSATPVVKTDPPENIERLDINIVSETLELNWPKLDTCGISNYFLRFSKNPDATWESSIPVVDVGADTTTVSLSARSGSYFVKAIDFVGNESTTAAKAVTSIPELSGLNLIEEINDFPGLLGTKEQVDIDVNSLLIQEKVSGTPGVTEYYSEGTYNFKDFLELGDIYTVRLQSLIEAEGFTPGDVMASWVTLDSVDFLSTARTSEWDVETQVRSRETFFQMSNWATLDSIDPISEGDQTEWTSWRKFTVGDFTGNIFQFRLLLKSNKASVTPRVLDGLVQADMPDRDLALNNITALIPGTQVNYEIPFYGPASLPQIRISQDNAQQGDRYEITNKTLNGFKINFYDSSNNPVVRQFDAFVKGYGRKSNEVI